MYSKVIPSEIHYLFRVNIRHWKNLELVWIPHSSWHRHTTCSKGQKRNQWNCINLDSLNISNLVLNNFLFAFGFHLGRFCGIGNVCLCHISNANGSTRSVNPRFNIGKSRSWWQRAHSPTSTREIERENEKAKKEFKFV